MSEASIVLSAIDGTKDAFNSVRNSLDSVKSSVGGVQGALTGLGASLGVLAFANVVKGAIESASALKDLSVQTGASVESLSKFATVGKMSGVGADDIASAMNRLAKNMSGVNEDGQGAAAALRAIGVDFDKFQKLSPDEKMSMLAKTLDGFQDGSAKSAVAMALLGKEGARLLPFMKDLAEVGDIQAKTTTEQADAAKSFEINMRRLQASGEAWKKELAQAMLPAMDEAARAFTAVLNGTGGLRDEIKKLAADGTIQSWTRDAITGLSYVLDVGSGVVRVFRTVGNALGAMGATAVAVANGNFSGALEIMRANSVDFENLWSAKTMGQQFRDRIADLQGVAKAAGEAKKQIDPNFGAKDKNDKNAKDQFAAVLKQISERTAAFKLETEQEGKLTEGQKLAITVLDQVRNGTLKLTAAKAQMLGKVLEEMLLGEKLKDQRAEERKALEDSVKAIDRTNQEIDKQILAEKERYTGLMQGKAAEAELAAADLERRAQMADNLALLFQTIDLTGQLTQAYVDQANKLRALAQDKRQTGALEDSVKNFKSVFESVDRTGHEVFNSLFKKGEDTFKKLRDTAKATLLDVLYQITAKPWFINIVAGLTGTPIAAAQTAMGMTGGLSGISGLGSLGGLTGSIGGMLGSFGSGGGILGSIGSALGIGGGVGGSFVSSVGAGLATDAMGATVAEGTAAATLGGLGTLGSLAAVAGPLAIGAMLIGSLIKSGGGPKQDAISSGLLGSTLGLGNRSASSDSAVTQIAQQWNSTLTGILGAYGRTSPYNIGIGYSTDPKGKSPSFLDVSLGEGGALDALFSSRNVGRSDQELQAAMQDYLSRALITGLEKAGLTGKIGDLLAGLGDVSTKSADEITAAMNQINAQVAQDQAIAKQKADLDEQLYQLTASAEDKTARAAAQARAAIDDANLAEFDRIQGLKDEQAAMEKATAWQQKMTGLFDKMVSVAPKFLNEEQMKPLLAQYIQQKMAAVGVQLTIEQIISATNQSYIAGFQALVNADMPDAASQLLDLADTFQTLTGSTASLGGAANQASDSVQQLQQTLQDLGKGLSSYLRELRVNRAGTAPARDVLAGSQSNYEQDIALARTGSVEAYQRLQGDAQSAIEAYKTNYGTGPQTQAFIDRVINEMSALPAVKSYEQQNLEVLTNIAAAIDKLPDNLLPSLQANFDKLDVNLDGVISFDEMKTLLSGKATDDQLHALFNMLDTNGDGTLSKLEILGAKGDTTNSTLVQIWQRLAGDSLLAYSASAVASVYALIANGTQTTAYYATQTASFTYATAIAQGSTNFWLQTIHDDLVSGRQVSMIRMAAGTYFAAGGSFGGGVRLVGERGPELEVTGPSRIFSASQTRDMLRGGFGGGDPRALEQLQRTQAAQAKSLERIEVMFQEYALRDLENGARLVQQGEGRSATERIERSRPRTERAVT